MKPENVHTNLATLKGGIRARTIGKLFIFLLLVLVWQGFA